MKRLTYIFTVCTVLLTAGFAGAQEVTVQGKVRDINTYREISYVNIYVKNGQSGTVSDYAGNFSLKVSRPPDQAIVVFRHIGYDIREIYLDSLRNQFTIFLQPRVIPLQEVSVEAQENPVYIDRDIPQAVSVIKYQQFAMRGYTDAGDLLNTDHSVQVDEELSGKKTVYIRGGNADDVAVLYNDVKLNSNFDNSFDLSLISLSDVQRVEVIKGSNTVLYGAGSLSGIVNVVPRIQQDYTVRFQQRIGTYQSGTWSLNLYRQFGGVHAAYSFKRGESRRQFADSQSDSEFLFNRASHHIAHLLIQNPRKEFGEKRNSLHGMFLHTETSYENRRYLESLNNNNTVGSLKFSGDIYWLKDLNISGSYHSLHEEQWLYSQVDAPPREIVNRSWKINADKSLSYRRLELLFSYQFESSRLDFEDAWILDYYLAGMEKIKMDRLHHGYALVAKYHAPSGYRFMSNMDFDISLRHDQIRDNKSTGVYRGQSYSPTLSSVMDPQIWKETMAKFSAHLSGSREDLNFEGYMNFGLNIKFPSLFEQVSTPVLPYPTADPPVLKPEKNQSAEVGIDVTKHIRNHKYLYGWQISGNFFKNYYDNKLRMYYTPGIPVAFYDNVRNAHITGLEATSRLFLFRKKITLELGVSRYFISEKAAFPFKTEQKNQIELRIDHAGYAFLVHVFTESDQIGWVRDSEGGFLEVSLPGRADADIHLGKTFEIWKVRMSGNLSVRNLFNNEVLLTGLALRDRRVYLTAAVQY
jgi:outer membrane receptor protein involved in Fe transport